MDVDSDAAATPNAAGQKRARELTELFTDNPFGVLTIDSTSTSAASSDYDDDEDEIYENRHLLGQLDAATVLKPHHPDSPFYEARDGDGYTELFPQVTDPSSPTKARREKRHEEHAREKLRKAAQATNGDQPATNAPAATRQGRPPGRPPGYRKAAAEALRDGRISAIQELDIRQKRAGLTATLRANAAAAAAAAAKLLANAAATATTPATTATGAPGTTTVQQFSAADATPTQLP